MSMSTHVLGFRAPDEKWQKMKLVWDACEKAGINPPEEVEDFFAGEKPDPLGVEVEIEEALKEWSDESGEGYEVALAKLPQGLTHLRFYNAW